MGKKEKPQSCISQKQLHDDVGHNVAVNIRFAKGFATSSLHKSEKQTPKKVEATAGLFFSYFTHKFHQSAHSASTQTWL